MSDQRKIVSNYIKTQILGVLATTNADGKPEAALVALTEVDDLKLVFGTYNTARKYQNLANDAHVAIVFGNSVEEATTIQYEGEATELTGEELDRCRDLHIQKNPRSQKFAHMPEQRFFKVTPVWIRFADLASKPKIEFELQF